MGIYDREYYRGETGGSAWFSGVSPVCKSIIAINVAVFLLQQAASIEHDSSTRVLRRVARRRPSGIFESGNC